jgi:hypothetical protein
MKKSLLFISICFCLSGCAAPPVYIVDNFHSKKIVRYDNDMFCFKEKYSVAWDNTCQSYCYNYCHGCKSKGYPVSYRSKEYACENDHMDMP